MSAACAQRVGIVAGRYRPWRRYHDGDELWTAGTQACVCLPPMPVTPAIRGRRGLASLGKAPVRDPAAPRAASASLRMTAAQGQLRVLGAWHLSIDGSALPVPLGGRRVLALLAVRGRQTRAQAAGTLFPDTDEEQALGRLRSTIARLNRCKRGLIDSVDGCLALANQLSVDVDQLAAVCRSFASADAGAALDRNSAFALIDAGELLQGWYEDWVLSDRDRIAARRTQALEALVMRSIEAAEYSLALEAAMAAVEADPLRESAHRSVIAVHLAEGNPVAALRQFESYRTLLRTELGAERPTPEMAAMVADLLVR